MMLTGEKVRLRAMEPADVDLLIQWENCTANWEVSGTIAPYSRSAMETFIKHSELTVFQTGQLRLMIESRSNTSTIGTIDLFDFDAFHRRAGVGILIALPEQRNQGIASESLQLLKEYAFGHLGLHQLYCNILSDNSVSIKLFKAAGFTISGNQHDWIRINNTYKDLYFMQLLKTI